MKNKTKTSKNLWFSQKIKIIFSQAVCLVIFFAIAIPCIAVSAGVVSTNSSPLNVRSGAGITYSVIGSLPKGGYVTLVEKTGNWWKVEYLQGKTGYVSADYISLIASETKVVATATGNLNVRSGMGTNYSILSTLPKGREVVVLSEKNGWAKIIYNGSKTGYVSVNYLSPSSEKQAENNQTTEKNDYQSETASNAVSLDIPRFSQTDSRWRYSYLGYSSKTIGSSGCTTCCIAMAESYLYGKMIYPHEMAKELSYSSSGDVYWKSNYEAYFSSDYLQKIFAELHKGRPVLVGAKTKSGGQHWVLVTGFNGGEITAANFTINDPGTANRKTLAEFFESFPIFYKIVMIR